MDDYQKLKEMLQEPNRFSKQKLTESIIKWVDFANDLAWKSEGLKKTIEQLEEENGDMAEKHVEKDIALVQLKRGYLEAKETLRLYKLQETILLERLENQALQMKEMKQNSRLIKFYEMEWENLRLAQEIEELKKQLGHS